MLEKRKCTIFTANYEQHEIPSSSHPHEKRFTSQSNTEVYDTIHFSLICLKENLQYEQPFTTYSVSHPHTSLSLTHENKRNTHVYPHCDKPNTSMLFKRHTVYSSLCTNLSPNPCLRASLQYLEFNPQDALGPAPVVRILTSAHRPEAKANSHGSCLVVHNRCKYHGQQTTCTV